MKLQVIAANRASISACERTRFSFPPAGGAAAGIGDAAGATGAAGAKEGFRACACEEFPIILAKRACCSALNPSIISPFVFYKMPSNLTSLSYGIRLLADPIVKVNSYQKNHSTFIVQRSKHYVYFSSIFIWESSPHMSLRHCSSCSTVMKPLEVPI